MRGLISSNGNSSSSRRRRNRNDLRPWRKNRRRVARSKRRASGWVMNTVGHIRQVGECVYGIAWRIRRGVRSIRRAVGCVYGTAGSIRRAVGHVDGTSGLILRRSNGLDSQVDEHAHFHGSPTVWTPGIYFSSEFDRDALRMKHVATVQKSVSV